MRVHAYGTARLRPHVGVCRIRRDQSERVARASSTGTAPDSAHITVDGYGRVEAYDIVDVLKVGSTSRVQLSSHVLLARRSRLPCASDRVHTHAVSMVRTC